MKHLLLLLVILCSSAAKKISAQDIVQDVTIVEHETYHEVSFPCDSRKSYTFYASESEGEEAYWFSIKTAKAGEDRTTLVEEDGVDYLRTTLPKPFVSWSTLSGPGSLMVVENPLVENPVTYVGVKFEHLGDRARITFNSRPYWTYKIWVSDSLEPKSWFVSDTLVDGERDQTMEVYGGEGETTSVELPIPFLPTFDPSKGFVKVQEISSGFMPGSRASRMLAMVPEKLLVCTRDGGKDKNTASTSIPYILHQHVSASGPKVAWTGKYTIIEASGIVSVTPLVGNNYKIQVPLMDDREPEVTPKIKQMVAMQQGPEGGEPTVVYHPNPAKDTEAAWSTEYQVRIESGTVFGLAAYGATKPLEEGVAIEWKGISAEVKFPPSVSTCEVEMNWQFTIMDREMYNAFKAIMEAAEKKK